MPEKKSNEVENFMQYLAPESKIHAKVLETFSGMDKPSVIFLLLETNSYPFAVFDFVRLFAEKNAETIYVTFNTSSEDLLSIFAEKSIPASGIKFVDISANVSGRQGDESKKISYIASAQDLTELDFQVTNSIKGLSGEKKLLVFDSVSDLLIYNEEAGTEKLLHAMINKIRSNGMAGIIVMIDSPSQEHIIKIVGHFCDKIARM